MHKDNFQKWNKGFKCFQQEERGQSGTVWVEEMEKTIEDEEILVRRKKRKRRRKSCCHL